MKVSLELFILHTGRDPFREWFVESATESRLPCLGEMMWNLLNRIMFLKFMTLIGSSNTVGSYVSL